MMVADPVYFAYLMASFSGVPTGVMVQLYCLRSSEEVHEGKQITVEESVIEEVFVVERSSMATKSKVLDSMCRYFLSYSEISS